MFEFKKWIEQDEYDLPDEDHMDRIRNTPSGADTIPDLQGDRFRFQMPMGHMEEFLISRGSIIGLKAPKGSLNAKCFNLLDQRKYVELYKTLRYIQFNNNSRIRNQLIYHK